MKNKNAIIISVSSDIGAALAKDWRSKGWNVSGTYRTPSPLVDKLTTQHGVHCYPCDLTNVQSVVNTCDAIIENYSSWDVMILAPGNLEPIGNFDTVDFDHWEESMQVNLLQQLRIVHRLLPKRAFSSDDLDPVVLFFAGGGTNNAVTHYSSYTLSKIALIKMCELLDAEIPDVRFVIVGPGCVKTKIHEPTLRLGSKASGDNYQRTLDRLHNNECTPMNDVIDCCNWLITTPCKEVGGRNFSVVSDAWGSNELEKKLNIDHDLYKLRRNSTIWKKN